MKLPCRVAHALIAFALPASSIAASNKPFYVIAHMTNTADAVRWAMKEGANAVEIDLRFGASGEPATFRHGGQIVCDCICSAGESRHVCRVPNMNCEASTSVAKMFKALLAEPTLALIILDTKLTGAESSTVQEKAGRRIIERLQDDMFAKGYKGKVIVSGGHRDIMSYIRAAANRAKTSPYGSRIFFSFDQEGGSTLDASCTIQTLARLPTMQRAFGTGVSACGTGEFESAIGTAVSNSNAGAVSFVYVWTLDKESSMRTYIDKGVNGILTNVPSRLVAVAKEKGLTLATPTSRMPAATSVTVLVAGHCPCDCDYHPGGCVVSVPAPIGEACKCSYKGGWTCGGSNVACKQPTSPACLNPDMAIASCVQGGGDCDGYKKKLCDCNYESGGCYISKVAPKGTACKCKYKGAWTCGGAVVACNNPTSPRCANPDASKEACLLGGGDCDAKRYK
jgi:glycerophosphoryl diester phosphodiesterase